MDNRIRFLESNEGKRELLWPVNEVDKSSLFGIIGHWLNTPVLVPLRRPPPPIGSETISIQ